ncbi:hypothetical protein JG687_00012771, partial [Phytophthora cactorum]
MDEWWIPRAVRRRLFRTWLAYLRVSDTRDVELYLPIASTPRCLWCNGYAPWNFTI